MFESLAMNAAILLALVLIQWAISVKIDDVSFIDAFWGAGMGILALASWLHVGGGPGALATLIMLVGSILFMGSLIGNPAMPAPGAAKAAQAAPRGVFAITRHPMMWSFGLWALAHILVFPQPAQIVISLSDRPVPFGEAAPDATQFFEAFALQDGTCIWEMF